MNLEKIGITLTSVIALCGIGATASANSSQNQDPKSNIPVTKAISTEKFNQTTSSQTFDNSNRSSQNQSTNFVKTPVNLYSNKRGHDQSLTKGCQGHTQQNDASNSTNNNQNIILYSSYKLSQIDKSTLAEIQDIANDNKSSISVNKSNESLNIYAELPNGSNNKDSINPPKIIKFSSFIGNMDNMNDDSNIPSGAVIVGAYRGQTYHGEHVKWHTHVHCNRFNGPHSDHRYWGKFNPKAWKDFIGSDCWDHAYKYHCKSKSTMSKCDGLDRRGHGVKDCSSWKGGRRHHNWSKRAWFRN